MNFPRIFLRSEFYVRKFLPSVFRESFIFYGVSDSSRYIEENKIFQKCKFRTILGRINFEI